MLKDFLTLADFTSCRRTLDGNVIPIDMTDEEFLNMKNKHIKELEKAMKLIEEKSHVSEKIDFAAEIIKLEQVNNLPEGFKRSLYKEVYEAAELMFRREVVPAAKKYLEENKQ